MTPPGRSSWPRASAGGRSRAEIAWSQALTHPVRIEILQLLLEQEVGTPSGFAEALEIPLGVASHHVRRLRDLALIRIVRRTHRRGAVQHHYRLADPATTAQALWRYGLVPAAAPVEPLPGTRDAAGWATLQRAVGDLRRRRERQGISQTALARRAGIRPDYYGRIERGEVDPRITVLLALAAALDTSLRDLFVVAERGRSGAAGRSAPA
jgi:DNA-binding XRE family transcriptional regulator